MIEGYKYILVSDEQLKKGYQVFADGVVTRHEYDVVFPGEIAGTWIVIDPESEMLKK